ncbi:MAG: TetR/AcrR family transcriptional regulator [Endomicrobiaceae bacterium]|nr:TetR/AcrR family transcriptional regulator [Endomicrobiaceae bacterium]
MTRPSHNIDVLLFDNGLKLLLKVGFDKFSIRRLCKETNVNLGMFHYYFKTREHFIELLFEQVLEKYLDAQKESAKKYSKAIDKLRAIIYQRAVTAVANKQLFFIIFKEMINRSFDKIIKNHKKEELKFLVPIIEQCKKDKDISQKLGIQYILPLLLPIANFAVVTELFKTESIDEQGTIIMKKNVNLKKYTDKLTDTIFRGLK